MLIENFKIGADIEAFLQHKETGEFVSAEGIVKGTKESPFKFDPDNHYFATSLDNCSAEWNIPPATSPYEFYLSVQKCIDYINSTIPQHLELNPSAVAVEFHDKYLQTDNAQRFGCDPSLDCYTLEQVYPQPRGDNWRACGTHIHVGYDKPNKKINVNLCKAMDLFLGIPAIVVEPDNMRRHVGYGGAGIFRHQKHGVEYRSLSSFFSSDRTMVEWCFNNTKLAIDFINNGGIRRILRKGQEIKTVIDSNNKSLANAFIKEYNVPMP
jgi:Phage phiEco32-like COOH.NH2 ligase-type 2